MSQASIVLANAAGATFRSNLNNALAALTSLQAGASAPSPTYAHQMWSDTANGLLKMRNSANDAWITLGALDQVSDDWTPYMDGSPLGAAAALGIDPLIVTSLRIGSIDLPTSAGSEGQGLVYNGSGDLVNGAVGGKIQQVVQTAKTDTFTLASTSTFTDVTGLSVAITPASASNKILVVASIWGCATGSPAGVRLLRGSTDILLGDAASSRTRVSGEFFQSPNSATDSSIYPVHIAFLDSPSTTSATTYKIQANITSGSGNLYINQTAIATDNAAYVRGASTITAMEIAA